MVLFSSFYIFFNIFFHIFLNGASAATFYHLTS